LVDLQAEGLVAADEIKAQLQGALDHWGKPPLALVLPQHLSTSQVVDLPATPESDIEKLITDEILRLGGLSESRIVYDFVRLDGRAQNRQQFWVTLCQEGEIRDRLARLGIEAEDLCEVTTTANALISAYRAAAPLSSRAILVHLGAQSTVVVIVLAGQGAFATSFPMGGDFFTRSLARARQCPERAAEGLKREENLLSGPKALPEFVAAVDGWVAELKRQLSEWGEHNRALAVEISAVEFIASGGGFGAPGLREHMKSRGVDLKAWPQSTQPDTPTPAAGFEVALGTALQALGYSAQPVSLLPEDYRLNWRKRLSRQLSR
jgi:Tfp pilus assembly PilM family ATPase